MKTTSKFLLVMAFMFVLSLPAFVYAQRVSNLVYECVSGSGDTAVYGNCSFEDLVAATRNVVNRLTILALEFTVVVIAYAGFKYMTSEGNPGKIREATNMFKNVAIGIGFIICAWVIVQLIARGLGVTSFTFTP
jgi:phosphotransacetylase